MQIKFYISTVSLVLTSMDRKSSLSQYKLYYGPSPEIKEKENNILMKPSQLVQYNVNYYDD